MKPNFALKLSNDGVELLHRAAGGWSSVGAVPFAGDDVAAGCARLVAEAERLEPAGLRSKLIIPDSEVRYATVVAPGPTDEARRYQIESEIERLTPYKIDELAYDWSVEEDHALVVICARETLIEAETFAEGYGFNPVSFVAQPAAGQFVGEPFFGETMVAPTLLAAGDHVHPDAEPVRVLPVRRAEPAKPPVAAPVAAPVSAPVSAPAPVPAAPVARPAAAGPAPVIPPVVVPAVASAPVVSAPVISGAPVARPAPGAAAPAKPATPRGPASRAIPTGTPDFGAGVGEARAKVGDLVRRMGTRLRREQVAAGAQAPVAPAPAVPAAPIETKAAEPVAPVAKAPVGVPGGAAAPAPRLAPGTVAPAAKPAADRPLADAPAAAAEPVAFASRRRPAPVVAASGTGAASGGAGANPGGRIAVLPGQPVAPAAGNARQWLRRNARRARRGLRQVLARFGGAGSGAAPVAKPRKNPVPEAIVPASRPPVTDREKVREAEAMTIFGARGMQRAESGLARRGLMAVGGLLMLLIAVAVWAIYFNGDETTTQLAGAETPAGEVLPAIAAPRDLPATGLAEVTPPSALSAPSQAAPAPDQPEATAVAALPETAQPDAGAPEAGLPDTSRSEVAAAAPDPEAMLESLVQEALNETLPTESLSGEIQPEPGPATGALASDAPAPEGAPVTTGDSPLAEAGSAAAGAEQAQDGLQLASNAVPAQRLSLPAGLETPPVGELAFAVPPPPPPFGTEFTFDERGLVEATPEGALTPTGVTVFARRPAVAPAPRPGTVLAPVAAPAEPAAEPVAQPAPATEPVAAAIESAIAEAVGQAAPEAAAPAPVEAPAAEVVYDDTPRADPALAGARPQPRPERVRALGEQPAPAPEEPGDQTQLQPAVAPLVETAALTPAATAAEGAGSAAGLTDEAGEATRSDSDTVTQLAALEAPPPGGVSLTGLRPQRRPTDLAPQAAAPAEAEAAEPVIDLSGATPEAVAQSPMPGARPDDVAERARRILAAATAAPAAPQAGGTAEEAEDQEGDSVSASAAAPTIPSSASVARAATESDAIRLNRINLIGVFGTPNDRRALVRLSSGRVVRVQVGDRLDGGQVAAIGENEVRYVKDGRNEVLRIGG